MKNNKLKFHRPAYKQPIVDNYVLTSSAFIQPELLPKRHFFRSQIQGFSSNFNDSDMPSINYQDLISPQHEPKAIKIFMKHILFTPNIILEEKNLKEVNKEVRDHPKKCFSYRVDEDSCDERHSSDPDIPSNKTILETGVNTPKEVLSSTQSSFRRDTMLSRDSKSGTGVIDSMTDFSTLTDDQIQSLVSQKMKRLEKYNRKLVLKDRQSLPNFGLSFSQIEALTNFQKRIRAVILRKKFLRAVRMDKEFEQKMNYIKLKKSLKMFESARNTDFLAKYSQVLTILPA
jgi:hypothetical protein